MFNLISPLHVKNFVKLNEHYVRKSVDLNNPAHVLIVLLSHTYIIWHSHHYTNHSKKLMSNLFKYLSQQTSRQRV